MDLQGERQKDISRNFDLPSGVHNRLAGFTPEVHGYFARNQSIVEFEDHRLPPPEPSVADRKDDAGNTKGPYQEIEANIPAWMISTSAPEADQEEEDNRIINYRDKDLSMIRLVSPI